MFKIPPRSVRIGKSEPLPDVAIPQKQEQGMPARFGLLNPNPLPDMAIHRAENARSVRIGKSESLPDVAIPQGMIYIAKKI